MNVFKIIILSLLTYGLSFSAQAQSKLLIGEIISKKDSSRLPGVHVVNISSNQATNSLGDGTFSLPYKNGDTIILTSIGYNNHFLYTGLFWIPSGQKINIFMSEKVYSLPGVDVNQYSSKEEFREEFNNQKPPEAIDDELFKYQGPSKLEDVDTDLNAHIPISSPFSFLYNKIGREARQAKKLAKAQEQTEREETIRNKYNYEVVQKVLELESSFDAKKFMEDCPLDDEFVLKAKEYDIVKAILDCQKQQQSSK